MGPKRQKVSKVEEENDKFYLEFVPSQEIGCTIEDNGTNEIILMACKGCETAFDPQDPHGKRNFVMHCLQCESYKFLDLYKSCFHCGKLCIDDISQSLHINNDHDGQFQSCVPVECVPSTSTKKEEEPEEKGKRKREKEPEQLINCVRRNEVQEVIDISGDEKQVSIRYPDICLEFIPNTEKGDEFIVTRDGKKFIHSKAKCRGCKLVMPTHDKESLTNFLVHSIKLCEEYRKMKGGIKFCFPCKVYCHDVDAFIQHSLQDDDCPSHGRYKSIYHRFIRKDFMRRT